MPAHLRDDLLRRNLDHRTVAIPTDDGAGIEGTVIFQRGHSTAGPGLLHLHGGGMVEGDRFAFMPRLLDWVVGHDAVALTVEYRLAPEHPDPVPVEDCYAALVWFAARTQPYGVDAERLVVVGGSAGGGLAAGTMLLARDRGTPQLSGALLNCPMLDDRNASTSARQFDGVGPWDRTSNAAAWTALLGERAGSDTVSPYAAPARAERLDGLPPVFIDVGSAEVFRDEAVAFASQLWADAGDAELHVWPGGYHGFDTSAPTAALSVSALDAQDAWLQRLLDRPAQSTLT